MYTKNIFADIFNIVVFLLLIIQPSQGWCDHISTLGAQSQVIQLVIGESKSISITHIKRIVVSNPKIVDVQYANNEMLYIVGKSLGNSSILISTDKKQYIYTIDVINNIKPLLDKIKTVFPNENKLLIQSINGDILLSGEVSTNLIKNKVILLTGHLYKNKIVDLLTVKKDPQILLEVKVVEIQKNYENKFGSTLYGSNSTKSLSGISNFSTGSLGQFTILKGGITTIIDTQLTKDNAKILAQPNIISMDNKTASFLAGGKLFIPIPIATNLGVSSVSLQEENYGVSLKFTPHIISDNRVGLAIDSEVSELAVSSTTYGTGNNLTIIPTIMTRKASTSLLLNDGDSLVIGGLLQNNISKVIQAFPYLSELPILGLLFKSHDYQENKTELIFVVTIRFIDNTASDVYFR
ncbi:pilus assembly protein N-terminal domain-containing protein [Ferrovum sp. PN-J185]|uniref:type II and III secretion system protein family protein n=1 Tax=Ferrovum sp. PN-J185 TaxID=1356306 RepID=UPI00079631A6|nr:pilus assembly protein N-terminal domain-containing protein [Ferrovum sp. PN-J185]KXW56730.1 type II secretion system protein D precursor [Ferrovum sp. PN-J185]MCC6067585.1 pilus assembly protein N-terminal domain-containing protein [Ferrovum sp. PN-J185]MDE2056496.1 pilus assembly protein N-terminal domain-containing protein [Betaproteobacteria bacterium]